MADSFVARNRMLAVLTGLFIAAALRASYPVTMPIAASILVTAAIWPVKPWLDRAVPSALSYLGTVLLLLAIIVSFVAALYFSTAQVVRAFAQNWDQFEKSYHSLTRWGEQWGLTLGGKEGYARLIGFGEEILSNAYNVFVQLGFITLLVVLGLSQVSTLGKKIEEEFATGNQRDITGAVSEIASKVRHYLGITTVTSFITGVASALWASVVGLDLALVWGVLNFLLNYIPVVGNLVGIVPPTIYALIQFQSWSVPTIFFVGFAVIQMVISNFVSPMLMGRSLSLPPVVVVVALAFWSWVWGIAGALIAVPLTVALVIVCEHFPSTRWIAVVLSSRPTVKDQCKVPL